MGQQEREQTVLVRGRYNFFAGSGTFTEGPNVVSAILGEKQAPQSDILRITERTKISKKLKLSAILEKEPLLITNEKIHIEDLPSGRRTWVKDIISIKPVPKHWIFAYEPETEDLPV